MLESLSYVGHALGFTGRRERGFPGGFKGFVYGLTDSIHRGERESPAKPSARNKPEN